MNPNPVADYMADVIDRAIERQPERSLQPPELPEPSAQARKDAADAFDAGDDLAQDWLADHWRDDVTRAFGMAALERSQADAALRREVVLSAPASAARMAAASAATHADRLQADAYESLRAAFVEQMAEEYE